MSFPKISQNFESIDNHGLLKEAKKRGIPVTPALNNRLMVIRGVMDDRRGDADRQGLIRRLQAIDNQRSTKLALAISAASLLFAVVSLSIALGK
jgi:uncharacterized protein HemY